METENNNVCIVLCTCPNDEAAERISSAIVEARLAACVNIVKAIQSVFRWDEKIQSENETLMIIKTVSSRYSELESMLQEVHPYDVPEILMIPVGAGSPPYLSWVMDETN